MKSAGLKKTCEDLCEAVVFADLNDLRTLTPLIDSFELIAKTDAPELDTAVLMAARQGAKLVNAIILQEVAKPKDSIRQLEALASALLAIFRDGRAANEAGIPAQFIVNTPRPSSKKRRVSSKSKKSLSTLAASDAAPEVEAVVEAPQPVASAPAEPSVSDVPIDIDMLQEFLGEAKDHLESADVHLLTLAQDPKQNDALNALFRAFHTIKGVAGCLMLNDVQRLAHEAENLLDKARNDELILTGAALDVSFESVDGLKAMFADLKKCLTEGRAPRTTAAALEFLERIRAAASGKTVEKPKSVSIPVSAPAAQPAKSPAMPAAPQAATISQTASAVKAPELPAAPTKGGTVVQMKEMLKEAVKVDADRLDRLVDTIGELVIAESMVSQSPELRGFASPVLLRHLSLLDKITRELQGMAMSLRMVPVRTTFQKMARLVHDLSKKIGKKVEFNMSGEDTELDKTVVDSIGDPLMHMIRNAVDHGLETDPADRVKLGKTETGHVELRAYHKGGNIFIEVRDDGRGLNRDAIVRKAVERGLIQEGQQLAERDIFNLIFLPGFSTAAKVTDVSGRGVGMDVVKRNIEALRGQVEIQSEVGKGSVFIIRLPLTLAIIDGMILRVGIERYIIPTLSILTTLRPTANDIRTMLHRGEMLMYQGGLVPLFRLNRIYDVPGAVQDPVQAIAIVVEDDGQRAAILADELLGQQQIVIKSLGEAMRGLPGLSGGAIMPDGQVGLILDASGLVGLARRTPVQTQEEAPCAAAANA